MCGIAGIISKHEPVSEEMLLSMGNSLFHRGPDDGGVWINKRKTVGFAHRRLAIIDLSPGGHQPMISADGNFTITFNGEIYNYKELRQELVGLGYLFKTKSDTEVLLYAYQEWKTKVLEKINGMFAFAIWDETEQTLFAARDPLGEKPLKYYLDDKCFIFASELKAILRHPNVVRTVDWKAVDLSLTYRYVPAPYTGFKNIYKLSAGHYLLFSGGKLNIFPYWKAEEHARLKSVFSEKELISEFWNLFTDSVKKRMVSDVPVGAFLSGGLDSSSVVAAMSEILNRPVKTFSVGFKNNPESEIPFAKLVANRFHTDHTEIYIEPDIVSLLPKIVHQFEEPFFDNSAVPTYVMSELTKQHVTVVLTGDGSDECFGGYPNQRFYHFLCLYKKIPLPVTNFISSVFGTMARAWHSPFNMKQWYRSELLTQPLIRAYVNYYGIWQRSLPETRWYLTKNDLYTPAMKEQIDLSFSEELMKKWLGNNLSSSYGNMNRAMLADVQSRLCDDYLMKVDFASMSFGLETRPPFLDKTLVEFALSIPQEYKIRYGEVKWILKQAVKNKLPEQILHRRKMGFGIPIISWFKNELHEFTKEQLLNGPSEMFEYIERSTVEKLIDDHKHARADYSNHIWSLLLLSIWLRQYFYEPDK